MGHTRNCKIFVWSILEGHTAGSQTTRSHLDALASTKPTVEPQRIVRIVYSNGRAVGTMYETVDGGQDGTWSRGCRYELQALKVRKAACDASHAAALRNVATSRATGLHVPRPIRRRSGTPRGIMRALREGAP